MLPKKVAILVSVSDSALVGNDGCFLRASCYTAATCYGISNHITTALIGNDGCFLRASFYTTASKLNWTETHTILPTFLGSTQEAHMCASCVLPSVASLTGRSVCFFSH